MHQDTLILGATSKSRTAAEVLQAGRRLCRALEKLKFREPVALVYNPMVYAWQPYQRYVERYARSQKRVIFLGMNPGPFGMVQTGVPFGEVSAVRDWLGISGTVAQPARQHPRRPVQGFDCPRREVSGQRLWGLFARRFESAAEFFSEHLVVNYCPLAFVEKTGRNRTPDKLPGREREALLEACDEHLCCVVRALEPEWLIGIGDFAFQRAEKLFGGGRPKLGRILHPSPASPAANRDWAGMAAGQLEQQGVWRRLSRKSPEPRT